MGGETELAAGGLSRCGEQTECNGCCQTSSLPRSCWRLSDARQPASRYRSRLRRPKLCKWRKLARPPLEIIQRMQDARAVYRLPASALAHLREQGAPDAVVDYMQQTY